MLLACVNGPARLVRVSLTKRQADLRTLNYTTRAVDTPAHVSTRAMVTTRADIELLMLMRLQVHRGRHVATLRVAVYRIRSIHAARHHVHVLRARPLVDIPLLLLTVLVCMRGAAASLLIVCFAFFRPILNLNVCHDEVVAVALIMIGHLAWHASHHGQTTWCLLILGTHVIEHSFKVYWIELNGYLDGRELLEVH